MIGRRVTKSRRSFYLAFIILLFLIPVILAWIFYADRFSLGKGHLNYGHLIQPPISLNDIPLYNANQKRLGSPFGKWMMVYFYPEPCGEHCAKGLYYVRQIRLAAGKNSLRIERAILTYRKNEIDPHLSAILTRQFPGTQHLLVDQTVFSQVMTKRVNTPYATKPGTLYLVDPMGNVMMAYPPSADPDGIFKDVQLLLKVSQIG